MMFVRSKTMASLAVCLAAGSCLPAGDFCGVVKRPLTFDPATARAIVRTDREAAEQIEVQNQYGGLHCEW